MSVEKAVFIKIMRKSIILHYSHFPVLYNIMLNEFVIKLYESLNINEKKKIKLNCKNLKECNKII